MIPDHPYAHWDAAYVLGALSDPEDREYEAHLATCSACWRVVAQLEPLPALLALLGDEPDAAPVEPAPLAALATAARRSRRRRSALLVAVAAATALLAGVAGSAVVTMLSTTSVEAAAVPVDLRPVGSSGVRADVSLTSEEWGTRLAWDCSYPADVAAGHRYELVAVDAHGVRRVVGTWIGDGRPTAGLTATTALSLDEIVRVELSSAISGRLLAAADL